MASEGIEESWAKAMAALKKHHETMRDEGVITEVGVKMQISKYVEKEERQKVVPELKAKGFSNKEIADLTGVDRKTIDRDLARTNVPESGTNVPDNAPTQPGPLSKALKQAETLREQVKVLQGALTEKGTDKKYSTVVIDPPWPMKKIDREVRPNQVEFDYPTMDEDQLRAFRSTFLRMTAKDCHVFMWTTQKFLPMALRLFNEYGVKYVLTMVWHKPGGFQPVKLPQYNCEFALYGRIGSPEFVDTKAFNCCFEAERREHSRKPDEFYDIVRRVTAGERVDVFSREKRDGFDQFGIETDKFGEAAE